MDLPSAPQGTHRRQVRPQKPGSRGPPRPPRGAEPAPHHGDSSGSLSLHRPPTGTSGARAWPKPGAPHETDSGGGAPGPGRPPAPRRPPAGCGHSRIHSPTFVQHSGTSLGRQKTPPPHPAPGAAPTRPAPLRGMECFPGQPVTPPLPAPGGPASCPWRPHPGATPAPQPPSPDSCVASGPDPESQLPKLKPRRPDHLPPDSATDTAPAS